MCQADKGIRTGYYYDDVVAPERDAPIVRSRRKGWSQPRIARPLGLLQRGVSEALQRNVEGGLGRDPRG
jgi:hypothetical protein